MRRLASLLLALLLLALPVLGMTACDETSGGTVTLYVYNWGEYISDGSEGTLDVNEMFEEWYYETYGVKVEVNYSTYSSNESMYAKLSSGSLPLKSCQAPPGACTKVSRVIISVSAKPMRLACKALSTLLHRMRMAISPVVGSLSR